VTDEQLHTVRLLGLDVAVHQRASEHQQALQRELALIEQSHDPSSAPARLQQLSVELAGRFDPHTEGQTQQLADAAAAGLATIDLVYRLPAAVVEATERLGALLDEVDTFCAEGDLLTLVTPAESLAYRRWFLGEFAAQIRDGRPPTPWDPSLAAGVDAPAGGTPAGPADNGLGTGVDGSVIAVEDDLDLELASTLRSQLAELSERGVTDITIDLARCPFIDSTGLSLLVTTYLRLTGTGGSLRILGASGQVATTFQRAAVAHLLSNG
jgi:anti-sigma B factor antagonist